MSHGELFLLAAGLSMDAVAVSMSNGMCYRNVRPAKLAAQPVLFGLFQGIMPLLGGLLAGGIFAAAVSRYAGIGVFLILGIIGGKMVQEGWSKRKGQSCEAVCRTEGLTYKILFFQALATSVDAFAVGIGLRLLSADLFFAVCLIAAVTTVMVTAAVFAGRAFGNALGFRAEVLGGVILIGIGLKSLLI